MASKGSETRPPRWRAEAPRMALIEPCRRRRTKRLGFGWLRPRLPALDSCPGLGSKNERRDRDRVWTTWGCRGFRRVQIKARDGVSAPRLRCRSSDRPKHGQWNCQWGRGGRYFLRTRSGPSFMGRFLFAAYRPWALDKKMHYY